MSLVGAIVAIAVGTASKGRATLSNNWFTSSGWDLGSSEREIRGTWGVPKEVMVGIVPYSWLDWGLGTEETPPQGPQRSTCACCARRELPESPNKIEQARQPGPSRRAYSFVGPAARGGKTAETGQNVREDKDSRFLGLELPPAFRRGQRTRSES